MKILLLTYYFKPDLSAGSFRTSTFVESLMSKLPPDASVDVVTTLPNRYSSYRVNASIFESIENLNIHRVKVCDNACGLIAQMISFFTFYINCMRIIRSNEYDVVFASSSRLFTAFLAARCARKKGARLFLDVRDLFLDTIISVFPKYIYAIFYYPILFIEKYTFSVADHINVVSPGFTEYIGKYYSGPVTEYTNGIDSEFLNTEFSLSEKNSKLKVVYAGNIGKGQELHKIVPDMALELEKTHEFVIIGDGARKSYLEQEIKLKRVSNVTFVRPLPRVELMELYRSADILFLHLDDKPAFKKVIPSKLFEYAATHKPILAGVAGYSTHIVASIEGAEMFSPCNLNEALSKLDALELTKHDRSNFIRKYSRESITEKLVSDFIEFSIMDKLNAG
ncbi:putative group 1 glycosyl transferase [Vibrio coralliirubri]|uniref:glycosyltransferase family 4 protein n=1 Tax=Vibrio coralliirubri TaxID=1516159 RepID=UPI00063A4F9A|nr:glycosyltransferase family 4 protein [Vibrio coralliirubri]CDT77947.1 putative group 1 glycosyl transferase [Vibrio coralliirubri]